MLQALADGETDPAALAVLANYRLRATQEQLREALGACQELNPVYRRLLKMALEGLQLIEKQIGQLDQEMADLLRPHQDQVQRLAEVVLRNNSVRPDSYLKVTTPGVRSCR